MEYRQLDFEIRQTDEDNGTFSGIANAFGVIDSYGSTFDKGAFTKTLSEQDNVPTVWFHDPTSPIGSAPRLRETDEGLYVEEAELNLDVPKAREVFSGMQFDPPYITEMSIGFETIQDETDGDGIEHKKEVKLYEVSPLTKNFAANPEAQISEVRDSIVGLRRLNRAAEKNTRDELMATVKEMRDTLDGIISSTKQEEESIDELLKQSSELVEDGIARLDGGSRDTTSNSGSPQGDGAAGIDPQLVKELREAGNKLINEVN